MIIKTHVKAGGRDLNHNAIALKIKTRVKAGGRDLNHNAIARR